MKSGTLLAPRVSRAALASALLVAASAQAAVVPFVEYYKTNVAANTTLDTNAAIKLLSGYSLLWSTGATWDTGAPAALGAPVMAASQAYVVRVTTQRTAAQADSAYFTDRRHQSYSAITGLGSLADAYRTAAGSATTIASVAADATQGKYDDKGTGAGSTGSPTVGKVATLVNTVRGNFSSSNPAKSFFNSPRPWRLNDDSLVVPMGTEGSSYYASTLADGSPNYSASPVSFPDYDSNVVVAPTLMAVRSATPVSDGGFVSGHTNASYLASLAMAYALPERYQGLLSNAASMGEDRIIAGMHTPLDVIGGRVLATALSAAILSDSANATLKSEARAQGAAFIAANRSASSDRFAGLDAVSLGQRKRDLARYTWRMTYGLPATGERDVPASVPQGAEALLETRQPYLDGAQRREVLRTTAIKSGHAVLDDAEGWGRLNLYAAVDGYDAFDGDVTVNMDATRGGFAAQDAWRNDIEGSGALVKYGSGTLALTGNNRYRGGTRIEAGSIIAASSQALGLGKVTVSGGTLVNFAPGALRVAGDFVQTNAGTLEAMLGNHRDGLHRGMLMVHGDVNLDGHLQVTFVGAVPRGATIPLLSFQGRRIGAFDTVTVAGLDADEYSISYGRNSVALNLKDRRHR